jgi:cyclopropane-fatty-acyl-phospholipid synthase
MERKILVKVLNQIQHGTLQLTFWDGKKETFGSGDPVLCIRINKPGILRKAIRKPSLIMGEAYMNGDVELDGPLEDLLKFAELNPLNLEFGSSLSKLSRLNKNKKTKQAQFVAHHYDVGNDFYKLWLDPTMSYSCAYFCKASDSLETAQRQKIDHILRKLQLNEGTHLLDIGSGWGHLLITAAKLYKTRGYGVSLSREQVSYAQKLAKQEGVDKLVQFKYMNYQDIPKKEQFDRIVSVGFFEHVGRGNLQDYFTVVDQHLKSGGISVLHSISHKDESPSDPWVDKYIFPGGYIPSVRETTSLLAENGFYLFDYENLGRHYAMTVERWLKEFRKHKSTVIAMYDERFYRMWELYLIGAMMTFKTGSSGLSQWTFKKGKDPSWPLTRAHLYK